MNPNKYVWVISLDERVLCVLDADYTPHGARTCLEAYINEFVSGVQVERLGNAVRNPGGMWTYFYIRRVEVFVDTRKFCSACRFEPHTCSTHQNRWVHQKQQQEG